MIDPHGNVIKYADGTVKMRPKRADPNKPGDLLKKDKFYLGEVVYVNVFEKRKEL